MVTRDVKPPPRRPRAPQRSVLAATEKLLSSLELNDVQQAQAEVARALALKLDACVRREPVGGDPTAGIAREWREVVDAIVGTVGDEGEFTDYLFGEVGDPADS